MKSLGKFPDPFIAEIAGQPDALRRAARQLAAHEDVLLALSGAAAGRTPVLTGMGSSYFACYPAVNELARRGRAAVMLDAAELLHFRTGMLGPQTLLVVVSQSGESAEVVRLLDGLGQGPGRPLVAAITNGSRNSLHDSADLSFNTGVGVETGPSTMTFAASLVTMAGVSMTIAGDHPGPIIERLTESVELVASAIERLLEDEELAERLVRWFNDREALVILGRGPARAAAEMGSLTIKEAVGMPVESLETAQFRHGPLELAGTDLAAMLIATEPETFDLDLAFAAELAGVGSSVLLVTAGASVLEGIENIAVGGLDRLLLPAASLVPSQLLAWRLAQLRGREPGAYVRASKVTTHE